MILRLGLVAGVLAGSIWLLRPRFAAFDPAAVFAALGQVSSWQMLAGLLAVATAFAAVSGQERAITAQMGLVLPRGRGARAAAATAALSQTIGFGPVVGALVRRRLLREVTLGQSFAISAGITLGFFAGLGLMVLATFALAPGLPHRGMAQAGLLAILAGMAALALSRAPTLFGLRRPNLFILGRFLFWLALDLAALAMVLWVLLPANAPAYAQLLPVFLIAIGLGVASGSPGGISPFEATLLAYLPQIDGAGLVAAILVFRTLAYALPAGCGAVWVLLRPGPPVEGASGVNGEPHPSPEALHGLPVAEAHLIRQGELTLQGLGGGALWLSGRLSHTRVMLGRVMGSALGALPAVEALAQAEARMLCLYKIDARQAAAARVRGYAVLPVAREAVLDPGSFTLNGPGRAGLRRKLAHARKAGIVISDCAEPPLAEMESVAAAWRAERGRERGFSMGRWERTYVAGQRVITARTAGGELVAFVTFHTCARQWTLDLVRVKSGVPDGTIYALILHAIALARWQEVEEVSLAAVPEPGFGLGGLSGRLLRRATSGAVGLAQFKSTFAPRWRRLYIAAPSRVALLIGGLDVTRAVLWPAPLARGRRLFVVLRRAVPAFREARERTDRAA